ncbi:hypothetical protein B296_00049343 [Ensete ventricosum]|uniref:Uncharacterized protein n=1 Tax=Ensete ventricosum TaxID=4639 RepID=A0A426XFQ8_ENSVE|nr:hypothetical protein B296_00049343 [Ensete ventricosum]
MSWVPYAKEKSTTHEDRPRSLGGVGTEVPPQGRRSTEERGVHIPREYENVPGPRPTASRQGFPVGRLNTGGSRFAASTIREDLNDDLGDELEGELREDIPTYSRNDHGEKEKSKTAPEPRK